MVRERTVLTARHLFTGCDKSSPILIEFEGKAYVATLAWASDPKADIALLSVPGLTAKPLELAEQDPSIGERVFTVGFPTGYRSGTPLLAVGYMAGYGEAGRVKDGPESRVRMTLVNVSANVGNSGGPFLDEQGRVFGMMSSKLMPASEAVGKAFQDLERNAATSGTEERTALFQMLSHLELHRQHGYARLVPVPFLREAIGP